MHTIRVTNYLGDRDDMMEILIIGPYPTEADRDAALDRLAKLPGVRGNFDLEPSQLGVLGADFSSSAEKLDNARDYHDIHRALFG